MMKRQSTDMTEIKWSPMLILSVIFHLAIFSIIFFVPESSSTIRPFKGVVYQVDLVEMPAAESQAPKGSSTAEMTAGKPVIKKDTTAKRIAAPKQASKPLVIAKKTVEKSIAKVTKPEVSATKLIDKAISKIERKVQTDQGDPVENAISKLESRLSTQGSGQGPGGPSMGGMPMQIYRMEAENWIKSNWSYPVAMDSSKDLETIVVLVVKRDGSVLSTRFEKTSANELFDESVSKAIKRSDPLPPFPEGYRKNHEEFVINFNLREFENQ